MTHKLIDNNSALNFCKLTKSFKEISKVLDSENSVIDDELLCELSLTFISKILVTICLKKISSYAILIKIKFEVIIFQNIKDFFFVDSQLFLLQFFHSVF